MRHTAYFRFADEAAAIDALPEYRVVGEDGEGWNTACIDADVPITSTPAVLGDCNEVVTPAVMATGYFLNLLLPERDESLEQIDGWVGTLLTDTKELIAGDRPRTPQRVFA